MWKSLDPMQTWFQILNFCVISPPCTSSKWVGHLPATWGYGYPQCTNPLAANVAPPFLMLYYENSNATRQEALYSQEFLHIDVAHLWLVQGTGQRGKGTSRRFPFHPHLSSLFGKFTKWPTAFSSDINTTSVLIFFSQTTPLSLYF